MENNLWDVKPGDEVICINDEFTVIQRFLIYNLPVMYGKYTIREIVHMQDQPNLRLEELVNYPLKTNIGTVEPAFHINRFRPVTKFDVTTDIKLFKELLTSTPKDAKPDDDEYLEKVKEKINDSEKTSDSGIKSNSRRSS